MHFKFETAKVQNYFGKCKEKIAYCFWFQVSKFQVVRRV